MLPIVKQISIFSNFAISFSSPHSKSTSITKVIIQYFEFNMTFFNKGTMNFHSLKMLKYVTGIELKPLIRTLTIRINSFFFQQLNITKQRKIFELQLK